jgi:hypothetical protein
MGVSFYLAIVADFGFCIHTIKLSDACGISKLMSSPRRAAVQYSYNSGISGIN